MRFRIKQYNNKPAIFITWNEKREPHGGALLKDVEYDYAVNVKVMHVNVAHEKAIYWVPIGDYVSKEVLEATIRELRYIRDKYPLCVKYAMRRHKDGRIYHDPKYTHIYIPMDDKNGRIYKLC